MKPCTLSPVESVRYLPTTPLELASPFGKRLDCEFSSNRADSQQLAASTTMRARTWCSASVSVFTYDTPVARPSAPVVTSRAIALGTIVSRLVWSAGGSIIAPLFTGGALKGQVEVRTAEQKQAVEQYAKVARQAFGDVENALSSELALEEREAILTAAVTDAERSVQLSETRYRVGAGDLRSVEQQQLAYYSSRMSLLRVQSERRVQRVNLHLALGGDFAASA